MCHPVCRHCLTHSKARRPTFGDRTLESPATAGLLLRVQAGEAQREAADAQPDQQPTNRERMESGPRPRHRARNAVPP